MTVSAHDPAPTAPAAPPSSPWTRAAEALDWRMNPVLLRDLRLYAKGRLLPGAYLLVLIGLALLSMFMAVVNPEIGADGRGLLGTLTTILALACGAVIPNLVFERFRAELNNRATELALMSPLTPARLVRGKLLAAWCASLVVISTSAPMMASAYLMGGLTFQAIVGVVASLALAALVMPCLQLFLATQRRARGVGRIINSLVFIGQVILMYSYSTLIQSLFLKEDLDGWETGVFYSCLVLALLVAQFLYAVTVSRLRGEAENRDAGARLSLAFAAYAGTAGALFGAWYWEIAPAHEPWLRVLSAVGCFTAWTFCIGFLIICHTNPVLPRNLREARARHPWRAFFLLPGLRALAAFFIANAVVILALGLYGSCVTRLLDVAPGFGGGVLYRFGCFSLVPFMAIAYGLVAHYYLVLRFVKRRRNPNLLPWTIGLTNLLLFFLSIGQSIAFFSMDESDIGGLTLAWNPITLFHGASGWNYELGDLFTGALAVMAVLLVLLLPMALGRRADQAGQRAAAGGGDGAEGAGGAMRRDRLLTLATRLGGHHRLIPPRQLGRGQAGVYLGDRQGQSVDFHDYRQYQPGDDLRRVDWRAYARSGQMQLKLYREEISPVVEVLLDTSVSMGAYPGKEQAAVFLAAFLHAAVDAVGGRTVLCRDGRRHPGRDCLAALADVAFTAPSAPLPVVDGAGKPLRFHIGDCLFADGAESVVARLARGALAFHPLMVLSRSERDPGLRGHCRLQDVEGGDAFLDLAVNDTAVAAYRTRLARHQDGVAAALRHGGALIALTAPDGDLTENDCQALVAALAAEEVVTA